MSWQSILLRTRAAATGLRNHFPPRRLVRIAGATCLVGAVLISMEAIVRAHIDPPEARVPTAVYTRTVPWGGDGEARTPVAIGTIDGAALESRIPIPLGEVPTAVVQAVLAVEDQRFFQHHGLDIKRIGGALIADVRARGITQGGSTLTQQLAKNLFLSADRTPLRKLREAALALVLELRYDKRTILQAYLNEIYLGQDGGRAIHGVAAAARYYFGKDLHRVTLAEAAQLAGMISAPNRNEPTRHPDAAKARRDVVLQLMADQQRISAASAQRAEDADISAGSHESSSVDGRYFRDFVAASVSRRLPARGNAVYTTLDARLQRAAERALQTGSSRLLARGAEAALVAIDPRTGEVLAMIGGHDYGASQFNRAVDAHRQPGSAFKPIVALAALAPADGKAPDFTLASVLDDEPLRVRVPGGAWEPTDYDQSFRGPVTLRTAMEQSLNIPFARIGLTVGPKRIVDAAKRVGITSPLQPVPSIALGSSEVTLLELVRAYGVLATGGQLASTRAVVAQGPAGRTLAVDTSSRSVSVENPAVAYLVTSALQGVVTRGTGAALNQGDRFGSVAGKTGTSNDWRDAWFVAYTPTLVVGVWVGYDDGRSLHSTGASAALPIVSTFLSQITPDDGWPAFDVPEGIAEGYVTAPDGNAGWDCGSREVFLQGTEPAGGECDHVEIPDWDGVRDLGSSLRVKAEQLLQRFIINHLEGRRLRR